MYVTYRIPSDMGWLHLVGSLQWQVSFAKEPYERDDILQKRPVIWRSLLIVATPYLNYKSHVLYLRIPQLHHHLRPMYRCSGGSRTAPWAHVQECMWHEDIWHVDRNVCDMTCRRHMTCSHSWHVIPDMSFLTCHMSSCHIHSIWHVGPVFGYPDYTTVGPCIGCSYVWHDSFIHFYVSHDSFVRDSFINS